MSGEVSRTCGTCGAQLLESNMLVHMKSCQNLSAKFTSPDGNKLEVEYTGSNLVDAINTMSAALTYRLTGRNMVCDN